MQALQIPAEHAFLYVQNAFATSEEVAWLKSQTKLPIVLKGIQSLHSARI